MMDENIIEFLRKQTAASVSCVNEIGEPYSFSCFFAFNSGDNLLYFKSSDTSYHVGLLLKNPPVSGTVMPDKLNAIKFKGIQFSGHILNMDEALCDDASKKYHQKFPFALAISGTVYTIQLDYIKMTGSILGKMQKMSWQRAVEESAV